MNPYSALAKKALEFYLGEGKILEPPKDLPANFYRDQAGVFVTILNGGELRGCIGTFKPTRDNVALEIIQNAISAGTCDKRFAGIAKEELPQLNYEVSILSKPTLAKKIQELDPQKFGIIVHGKNSGRLALLLPSLPNIKTIEEQLASCCQKAGINPNDEKIIIYKFETKKYTSE